MSDTENSKLAGRRILVVEDEFYLAEDLCRALSEEGADVAGPASSIRKAKALIAEQRVDLAVLDVNLKGELVFPLADELRLQKVPFVFTTGYDDIMIPVEYQTIERWEKPLATAKLIKRLAQL